MSRPRAGLMACVVLLAAATSIDGQGPALTIVRADPNGELEALADADQVRIVFSEPMVPLGTVADGTRPPWIRTTPEVTGSFYWSGTRTLVFSPDESAPLPWATRFTVRVDPSATSVAGRRLREPFELTFTTPTVRLLQHHWYRRDQRFDQPVVIVLRFNQPVRPEDAAAHTRVTLTPHEWPRPILGASDRELWRQTDPAGLDAFDRKVATVDRVAAARDTIGVRVAESWDWRRTLYEPWLVVLETTSAPLPDAWLTVTVDPTLPSAGGPERHPAQTAILKLEPTFFAWPPGPRQLPLVGAMDRLGFTQPASLQAVARALTIIDVTDATVETPVVPEPIVPDGDVYQFSPGVEFGRLGLPRQPPLSRWRLRLDSSLQARDGQTLGYSWLGFSERGHEPAVFGFAGSVFEAGLGSAVPLFSRNVTSVRQRLLPVLPQSLMPTIQRLRDLSGTRGSLPSRVVDPDLSSLGVVRQLPVTPDTLQRHAVDLRQAGPGPTGLYSASVGYPTAIPGSNAPYYPAISDVLQVTNLGVTVKYSVNAALVFVTRLDNGLPVSDARVAIVDRTNATRWSGRTGPDGVALVERFVRPEDAIWQNSFIVTAEKDGDVAFVASTWSGRGQQRGARVRSFDWRDAGTALSGRVFTDRGVYKRSDIVRFKAVVRDDTPDGIKVLGDGTRLDVVTYDARRREVDKRTVTVSSWSGAEWTWAVPPGAPLGGYSFEVMRTGSEKPGYEVPSIRGTFMVSAYRTPDFRVDAALTAAPAILGSSLRGTVTGEYLFGAPLVSRPVTWLVSRRRSHQVPQAIRDRYPEAGYDIGYSASEYRRPEPSVPVERGALGPDGRLTFDVATPVGDDAPYEYVVQGSVHALSDQTLSSSASIVMHPSSLYVVMSRPPTFAATRDLDIRIGAVDLSGQPVPDVPVNVGLVRREWTYPRDPFTPVMREVALGEWSVRTGPTDVGLRIVVPTGGSYIVRATAQDGSGRPTRTESYVYGVGGVGPRWREEGNRIELTPERGTWKPGETARILVQSPWERATALLTVEREGIRRHRTFTMTSSENVIDVPITESDVPNVFVSVVLVKGRTSREFAADGSDPGRPAYRVGHVELSVDDALKRLRVDVSSDRREYRPGESARVAVSVAAADGRPVSGEVTLWAVDHGVLSLTGYSAPDVLKAIYRAKSLQVMTVDNRERLVTAPTSEETASASSQLVDGMSLRAVLDANLASMSLGRLLVPGLRRDSVREDFRPLVFWLGSVHTGADGRAGTAVRLPESLTTYRIMAVAADRASRFGHGEHEIRTRKTLALLPAFPRFLSPGDRAFFGGVLTYTGDKRGEAVVSIQSLDPGAVRFGGVSSQRVLLEPGASVPVRFDAVATREGSARVRMTARMSDETDTFELPLAVTSHVRPETTAAYGEVSGATATEWLRLPANPDPHRGGLSVELSPTALVGLGESARYVTNYWHRGAEQRASRALALLLASEFDGAFRLSDIPPGQVRAAGEAELRALSELYCDRGGGISTWPGPDGCSAVSPYLTAYVLHVMRVAKGLRLSVDERTIERCLDYLERHAAAPPPRPELWVAWTSAQAYALKVLAEYGRTPKDVARLLAEVDRLPTFARSFLADALHAQGDRGPQYEDLVRRITNTIRIAADRAHVEDSDDSFLASMWVTDVSSTAIVLEGLSRRGDAPALVASLARWLLAARTGGRWGDTYANARALEALFAYYRSYEADAPRSANVNIEGVQVGQTRFRQRSMAAQQVNVPMRDLLQHLSRAAAPALSISTIGKGRVYYTAQVQSFVPEPSTAFDRGFRVERRYARFVEDGSAPPSTTFSAGDLVRVTVTMTLRGDGWYLALTDPLPAGFEPVEGAFQTTERRLARRTVLLNDHETGDWWHRGTFDHIEKHDDRVVAFATRLGSGRHEFSYLVRATTRGSFGAAGARVEAMYAPELNGRSAAATIRVE